MDDFSRLALLVAAFTPASWVWSLFYDEKGKLTVPGYDLPSAGFGLLAFVSFVQFVVVGIVAYLSSKHPELRGVGLSMLATSLLAMLAFSTFSYVFAHSRFAKLGVWHGAIGLLFLIFAAATS